MLEKGILIIANRHPYYGRMAYNLACTIKACEDFPVAVVTDSVGLTHLGPHQKDIFDHIIDAPVDYPIGFATKLYANLLTPFKKTLLLDADMLWLHQRTPSEFFDEMQGIEYTGITEGWIDLSDTENRDNVREDYHFWADVEEIKKVYALTSGILYQWRSEIIYFEKTEKVDAFFETARQINFNPKLDSIIKFVDKIPDELSINISSVIHGIEPHKIKWTPAYWNKVNKNVVLSLPDLSEWYLVSFGNHWSDSPVKKLYDKISSIALRKLGRQHVFSLHSKKEYLPERIKM